MADEEEEVVALLDDLESARNSLHRALESGLAVAAEARCEVAAQSISSAIDRVWRLHGKPDPVGSPEAAKPPLPESYLARYARSIAEQRTEGLERLAAEAIAQAGGDVSRVRMVEQRDSLGTRTSWHFEVGEAEARCPVCDRHVMAKPKAASGILAPCGRRLTRLSECGTAIGKCKDG